jgi:putative endonuclease
MSEDSEWVVYMLYCKDDTIYTGITNNLPERVKKHNKGTASKYTRARLPVDLVFTISCADRSVASKLEYFIKFYVHSGLHS